VFVLDTDAITHDENAHKILSAKVKSAPRKQLFTTSVTIEEQLKGRLAYINKHRNNPRRSAQGHAALVQTVYYCFVKLNFALLTTFRRRGYALFQTGFT
jgi:hypothetical protein